MSADSVNETSKSTHGKGKPKVGAITVDSTTAQQISQLQGAVKGLTNLVKGVQLNTNPTQSSKKFHFRYWSTYFPKSKFYTFI